jgi:uncharacterized YigZ family protein
MSKTYRTVAGPVEAVIREKGSRFIGFVYPVNNTEEVKEHLENIKAIHPKATHHCFAWRLGPDKDNYRAFDDGEPAGTAGRPILGQIDSAELTNTMIIVVRYYGGTKLGVPGLIAAYKEAAKSVLEMAGIVEKEVLQYLRITCNYEDAGAVFAAAGKCHARVLSQAMGNKAVIDLAIREEEIDNLKIHFPYNMMYEIEIQGTC